MPPAARITDPTMHGSPLFPGPGSFNVLIGGLFAWRTIIDQHACPAVSITGADGIGTVLMGSPTVLINDQMSCRQLDIVVEVPGLALGPANPIMMGCPTVIIGVAGLSGVHVVEPAVSAPSAPNEITEANLQGTLATLERMARGDSQIKIEGTQLFKGQVLAALARLMSRPTGRGLVNDLDKAPHPTTIQSTSGGNQISFLRSAFFDRAKGVPSPGSAGTVEWNPDRTKLDGEPWQTRDSAIGLGHELVHAYHAVRGTMDERNLTPYVDLEGKIRTTLGRELQAVGLESHANELYTENRMRAEHDAKVSIIRRLESQRPRY
jgi:hypothetical protein